MSYDFCITRGRVRVAEAPLLIAELLQFASRKSFAVSPINFVFTGLGGSSTPEEALLCEIFDEVPAGGEEPLAGRKVLKKVDGKGQEESFAILEREHIQGFIFHTTYEPWTVTWNLSHNGLIAGYGIRGDGSEPPALFVGEHPVRPEGILEQLDRFNQEAPVELHGRIDEYLLKAISCPWRRTEVAEAVEMLRILASYSDGFEVQDDQGLWPDPNFKTWNNLAAKYGRVLGIRPVHRDLGEAE